MVLIKYINKEGNFAMLETDAEPTRGDRVEKLGNTYFEKKELMVAKFEEATIEPVEEIKEEVEIHKYDVDPVEAQKEMMKDIEEQIEVYDEQAMKDFLREKRVRGFGLLKGDSLKKKAIEM